MYDDFFIKLVNKHVDKIEVVKDIELYRSMHEHDFPHSVSKFKKKLDDNFVKVYKVREKDILKRIKKKHVFFSKKELLESLDRKAFRKYVQEKSIVVFYLEIRNLSSEEIDRFL